MAGELQFVTVRVDKKSLDEVRNLLSTVRNGAETAIRRAANDTAVTARSRIVKRVSTRLHLTQTRIRKDTSILRAKFGSLVAKAVIFRRPIPLIEFPHLQSIVGVSVEVRKSRAPEFYRHRFIAQMRSGHIGIFERRLNQSTGRRYGRLPVEEQAGPAIGNVFWQNDEREIMADLMVLFQQRVIARAEFILSKA